MLCSRSYHCFVLKLCLQFHYDFIITRFKFDKRKQFNCFVIKLHTSRAIQEYNHQIIYFYTEILNEISLIKIQIMRLKGQVMNACSILHF